MLITKEQQEAMVYRYILDKHNQDEVNGFIDGLNAMLDLVAKKLEAESKAAANKPNIHPVFDDILKGFKLS